MSEQSRDSVIISVQSSSDEDDQDQPLTITAEIHSSFDKRFEDLEIPLEASSEKCNCKCWVYMRFIDERVVWPSNLPSYIFVTYDVDNLDGRNKGNFSQDEFYGTASSATNHLSWDNLGVQRHAAKII
jgi:hypothetical protein